MLLLMTKSNLTILTKPTGSLIIIKIIIVIVRMGRWHWLLFRRTMV